MAHFQPLVKPETQLTSSRFDMDLDSSVLDSVDCTPKTKNLMMSLKRKASQLLDQGSPHTTSPFLKWRLAVVESTLRVRAVQKQALSEANTFFDDAGKPKTEFVALVKEDEKVLLSEKVFLLSERKVLEEDLNDIVTSREQLKDAYITELRISLEAASSSKERLPGLKAPRLDRKQFRDSVNEYLGTKTENPDTEDSRIWCNVLGYWLGSGSVKCAHIVPYSWNTKDTAHMFGSDEAPLTSRRNGLSLQKKIEEGFDNCWITIVPVDSVESSPTEWKVILLNTAERDKPFFEDMSKETDRGLWRWRDIDGRKLSFPNDNRPARRFLYMRYALAWLHADDKSWPGFQQKLPPGGVWASPNKPDGYLRKSILLEVGKKTGDRLPKDLVSAGIFEDPDTSSVVHDEVAGIRVAELVQGHLDGMRDSKVDEDSRERAGEEEDLMEDE
ncbi:hypothetical protein HO133_008595 [Letharia lupina]|uniref:HNH nuclease domain-containing protein n=1 Tax=Letharia lupina TaxID=560253 RepID=A0A8H6CPG7_9LECA|nr:uncharacterized protein HO133_008595 [Letharia lupina]KAF6227153.1 hypothetical protein HO133_008595 [Letharia lupina]